MPSGQANKGAAHGTTDNGQKEAEDLWAVKAGTDKKTRPWERSGERAAEKTCVGGPKGDKMGPVSLILSYVVVKEDCGIQSPSWLATKNRGGE